ncbi:polysaccharide deacetylase family protein [Zhouia sp. PK063]|uniref:polysaccharide deacetylase family protein n=1 Tax=Zhouia sp. PK063 TaxID=3373602 RepID=UPI0037B54973
MKLYLVKTPKLVKKATPSLTWDITTNEKEIYLTFDDGPTPEVTPWVLQQLQKYNAKATFFCIGKNVKTNKTLYEQLLNEGHSVGNHTQNHKNGWKVNTNNYFENVHIAEEVITSNLFRPPYGKITPAITKKLLQRKYKIIMWDVLSADFDSTISKEECLNNVLKNTKKGSIVVFHDSVKAFKKLEFVLPKVLQHFTKIGYTFGTIT